MAMIFEDVIPSPIENARVQQMVRDGVRRSFYITPNEGYVLHDNARDWTEIDPVTMEEISKLGYTTGTASCGPTYDFTENPREFYTVLASEVPADQIFGGGDDHEAM